MVSTGVNQSDVFKESSVGHSSGFGSLWSVLASGGVVFEVPGVKGMSGPVKSMGVNQSDVFKESSVGHSSGFGSLWFVLATGGVVF